MQLFAHSKEFQTGMGKIRPGWDYILVSQDGSGDFDDIQSAIDSLPTTGGKVYIKEGTYTITTAITIPYDDIWLEGAGNATIIQTVGNITGINVGNHDSCTIKSLQVIGSAAGGANIGIDLLSSGGHLIDKCKVTLCGNIGINFISNHRTLVKDCVITFCGDVGIYVGGCQYMKLLFNLINNNDTVNIQIHNNVVDCLLLGNHIKAAGTHGVYATGASGRGIVLTSNQFVQNAGKAMYFDGPDNSVINGNYTYSNTGVGLEITAGSDETLVICNMFKSDTVTDNGTNTDFSHNFIT